MQSIYKAQTGFYLAKQCYLSASTVTSWTPLWMTSREAARSGIRFRLLVYRLSPPSVMYLKINLWSISGKCSHLATCFTLKLMVCEIQMFNVQVALLYHRLLLNIPTSRAQHREIGYLPVFLGSFAFFCVGLQANLFLDWSPQISSKAHFKYCGFAKKQDRSKKQHSRKKKKEKKISSIYPSRNRN